MLKNSRAILNLAAVVKVSVVNDYNYKVLLRKITLRNLAGCCSKEVKDDFERRVTVFFSGGVVLA